MSWLVVPVAIWPFHSWPLISPVSLYSWKYLLDATNVHSIGPTKAPVKSAPRSLFAGPHLPITSNVDPALENVPPVQMLPLAKAPVEKNTEPIACPEPMDVELMLTLLNCSPNDVMPLAVIVTEPNWLVRSIVSARATAGKTTTSSASSAVHTTRLICSLHRITSVAKY